MTKKGGHPSAETIEKMRASSTSRTHSLESRAKMSISHKGKVISPETREKLSKIQTGKPSGNKGKKQSAEVLARLSAIRKGRPWSAAMRAKMTGRHASEETKDKMSKVRKGKSLNLGEQERMRRRIAAIGNKRGLGYKHTDEAHDKMHLAQLGNKKFFGHKHSEETKEKMRKPKSAEARSNISAGHRQASVTKNTKIELKMKSLLLSWGIPFSHNHKIEGVGWVDFFFDEYQRVIECDGDYWHSFPERQTADKRKDNELKLRGVPILRLPEHKINKSWDSVVIDVYDFLMEKTK